MDKIVSERGNHAYYDDFASDFKADAFVSGVIERTLVSWESDDSSSSLFPYAMR